MLEKIISKRGRVTRELAKLFLNHMDAWGLTLTIAFVCLAIHDAISWRNLGLLAALTGLCWVSFAYNDYHDAPFDAQDRKKARRNFFVSTPIPHYWGMTALIAIVAILFAAFAGFGWAGLLVLSLSVLALWAYSAPPLRLKRRPGLDLLTHAAFVQTAPYLATLIVIETPWTPLDYMMLIIFVLSSLAGQLEQQARDFEVDSLTETNFAIWIGLKPTIAFLRIVTAALIIIAAVNIYLGAVPAYLVPFALIALPILVHRLVRRFDVPRSEWLVRLTVIAALLYTGALGAYSLILRLGSLGWVGR